MLRKILNSLVLQWGHEKFDYCYFWVRSGIDFRQFSFNVILQSLLQRRVGRRQCKPTKHANQGCWLDLSFALLITFFAKLCFILPIFQTFLWTFSVISFLKCWWQWIFWQLKYNMYSTFNIFTIQKNYGIIQNHILNYIVNFFLLRWRKRVFIRKERLIKSSRLLWGASVKVNWCIHSIRAFQYLSC